jgi:hypothetical protein
LTDGLRERSPRLHVSRERPFPELLHRRSLTNKQDGGSKAQGGLSSAQNDIDYTSGRKITIFISYLRTILAAVLLFGAMLSLYAAKSDGLKLGLVTLFTILFAASVGLLTNAKKSELYSATAA